MSAPRCPTWSSNMRVIEKEMLAAIRAGRNWKSDNTEVRYAPPDAGGWETPQVFLHGNLIARARPAGDPRNEWEFTLAGWNTPTTRSRINALMGAFRLGEGVSTRKGQAYWSYPNGGKTIGNDEWF
ncbi:hypothetical protein AVU67_gp04 [Ralstonia phage RSJ2]|uniref:Uncharacterized protein n=1 Tax=Ralstonia phage RSJ2 TaxID=1481785 RepID=A0A068Q6X6_9CAUD|nr:hypothetical protein AVU67_gp04 [Ralstonia phage RSJ2]BAP15810.1 hypothetical protein [Ralstonia phage RSJ2]